jgi:phytoene dehydrogenase-like protein
LLPIARKILFDVTPCQLVAIAGESLPESYRRRLGNYRYGPGVFKIDYALSEPAPWTNPRIQGAGTVHLGNTLPEIALSERQCTTGIHAEKPYLMRPAPQLASIPPGHIVTFRMALIRT